jgi:hypothetical protein
MTGAYSGVRTAATSIRRTRRADEDAAEVDQARDVCFGSLAAATADSICFTPRKRTLRRDREMFASNPRKRIDEDEGEGRG